MISILGASGLRPKPCARDIWGKSKSSNIANWGFLQLMFCSSNLLVFSNLGDKLFLKNFNLVLDDFHNFDTLP